MQAVVRDHRTGMPQQYSAIPTGGGARGDSLFFQLLSVGCIHAQEYGLQSIFRVCMYVALQCQQIAVEFVTVQHHGFAALFHRAGRPQQQTEHALHQKGNQQQPVDRVAFIDLHRLIMKMGFSLAKRAEAAINFIESSALSSTLFAGNEDDECC